MCCLPVNQIEERADQKNLPSEQNVFEELPSMEIIALASYNGYNKEREGGALLE